MVLDGYFALGVADTSAVRSREGGPELQETVATTAATTAAVNGALTETYTMRVMATPVGRY